MHTIIEPHTPTTDSKCSDVPYAIQVGSPGPYADRDASGVRIGAWGAGLCSCLQHLVPNCCMATCCPCVSLAQIAARLGLCRFANVLCGLLLVALVQLIAAFIAFVQVHNGDGDGRAKSSSGSGVLSIRWSRYEPRNLLDITIGYNKTASTRARDDDEFEVLDMAANRWGVLCLVISCVYILFAWFLRQKIRTRFAIRGSSVLDFVVALLLPCCNIAQMATHVKSYKPRECSFGPPAVLPAYPELC